MPRTLRRIVPPLATLAALVLVLGFAVASHGFPVRKLELNDNGVWVTNNAQAVYGRLNKAASSIDGYLNPPGQARANYDLDIFQDASAVVARDVSGGRLIPLDTASVVNLVDGAVTVSPDSVVDMRGGTIATLNPTTGEIRAARYVATSAVDLTTLDDTTKPIATLTKSTAESGVSAALAVGADGVVHAVSRTGNRIDITPAGTGFAEPISSDVGSALGSVQVTVVGKATVILDAVKGMVYLDGGKTRHIAADANARLQQPGTTAASVLLSTTKGLSTVALDGTGSTELFGGAGGAPAAPVRLQGCDFAAWAGTPGVVVRACDGGKATKQAVDRDAGTLVRPVFRVNRGALVLNDTADGRIYDVDLQRSLDTWDEIKPKQQANDKNAKDSNKTNLDQPEPKANPDEYGVRPDKTTVLHVLDNDTDPGGNILAVTEVTQPAGGATVVIAPDGQTLQYHQPAQGGSSSFEYTITNGVKKATAKVTIVARAATDNRAPALRTGATTPEFTVASYGRLAIPVINDWRDYDGDAVTVVSATANGSALPVTAEGRIDFSAGKADSAQSVTVSYQVTDGAGQTATAEVKVNELAFNVTQGVAPVAEPDSARGQVGKPILVYPLINDVPGSDPANPQAALAIAAKVASTADLKVETDLRSGLVSATATKAGTYFLDYSAAFGSSAFAQGRIRIDVRAADDNITPVAVPDQIAVRGRTPVMVDAIGNDFDPIGSVLTVQSATATTDQIDVAVIEGRWVRIMPNADQLSPNPQVVHYTVSNGRAEATGDITVTQLPVGATDRAIVRADYATVRDGDSVLIPVLDNDSSESGSPLVLDNNVTGAVAGQLTVIDPSVAAGQPPGDIGKAYVVGNKIRYVAPAKVDAAKQVKIQYQAGVAGGEQASGLVTVTINPQPADATADQAPAPQLIETRAVAGDEVKIAIPTSGQDPDGDSVTVIGIAAAPKLGRIIGFSPTSLTYQALPTEESVGTDSIEYVVADRYGKTGHAVVRIALTPPGQTQPPVAVDDLVVAKPGATVTVNPLANDLIATNDKPKLTDLAKVNAEMPKGVTEDGTSITVTTPAASASGLQFAYALSGNGGVGPAATIRVQSREGYLNPPRLNDKVAKIDGTTASVDVLSDAWDPDGPTSALKVTAVSNTEAMIAGGTVTVPVTQAPQVLTFEVSDGDGATSSAVLYVPASGSDIPFLKTGGLIKVDQNGSVTVKLADYIESATGRPIRITLADSLVTTPAAYLTVEPVDAQTIKLTASKDYVGPAAVSLEVMDAESATAPDVRTAVISIPVQVGPATPVLRCPKSSQMLVQGGQPLELDIATLCHVWTADGSTDQLTFTASQKTPLEGVSVTPGHVVTLKAAGTARGGSSTEIEIGVEGALTVKQSIPLLIKAAPRPAMALKSITDVKQGTTVTQNLAMISPLLDGVPTVVNITQTSGLPATATFTGALMTFTPRSDAHGTMTFQVTASDLADRSRTDRQVTGTLTMTVYGIPDAPGAPQPGQSIQTHAASLTWTPGLDNGAPILEYELSGGGKTVFCGAVTRCDVTGLKNGSPITFQVRARNKAGWGPQSAAGPSFIPDEPPGQVTGLKASDPQDHTLTLSWNAAPVDGTAVTKYHVTWGGGNLSLDGGTTSTTVKGLDNNTLYTFTVVAENRAGLSRLAATTQGQSSGAPLGLTAPRITPSGLGATAQVAVSWAAADPNGPKPVTYQVTRTGGSSGTKTFAPTQATSVGDTVTYDGTQYTYSVTAMNATGGAIHTSSPQLAKWQATGIPAAWGSWTAVAGNNGSVQDGTVTLAYTVPASRGATSTVTLLGGPGGTLPSPGPAGGAIVKVLSGFTNGTTYSLKLQVCNEINQCTTSGAVSVTPYGPMYFGAFSASASGTLGDYIVRFTIIAEANGKNAMVVVKSNQNGQVWQTPMGTGTLSLPNGYNVGAPNTSVSFTATLIDGLAPLRPTISVTSNTVSTPSKLNPSYAFTRSATTAGCGTITDSPCYLVTIVLRNYAANQRVYCTVPGVNAPDWNGNIPVDGAGNKDWTPGNLISGAHWDMTNFGTCHT